MASCGGCDRTWTGLTECHCATCHRHFGGIEGFDMHRVGGRCSDPSELRTPQMAALDCPP